MAPVDSYAIDMNGGGGAGCSSSFPAPVPTSTSADSSAVAAARLLRGALEAALLPRLEAVEGRVGDMEVRIVGALEAKVVERLEAMEGRIMRRMGDQELHREEEVEAPERQLTASPEAVVAGMQAQEQGQEQEQEQRDQGQGQGLKQREQELAEAGAQEQGQGQERVEVQVQEQEQPPANTLAELEQRIREELKVMWAGWWGGSACAPGWSGWERRRGIGKGGMRVGTTE